MIMTECLVKEGSHLGGGGGGGGAGGGEGDMKSMGGRKREGRN